LDVGFPGDIYERTQLDAERERERERERGRVQSTVNQSMVDFVIYDEQWIDDNGFYSQGTPLQTVLGAYCPSTLLGWLLAVGDPRSVKSVGATITKQYKMRERERRREG
jgi:hypothetical protein